MGRPGPCKSFSTPIANVTTAHGGPDSSPSPPRRPRRTLRAGVISGYLEADARPVAHGVASPVAQASTLSRARSGGPRELSSLPPRQREHCSHRPSACELSSRAGGGGCEGRGSSPPPPRARNLLRARISFCRENRPAQASPAQACPVRRHPSGVPQPGLPSQAPQPVRRRPERRSATRRTSAQRVRERHHQR